MNILIIIISMDKQSVSLIDQAIKSLQSVLANVPFTNNFKIELYQHYIPLHVYDDNCCQIYDMCIYQKYQQIGNIFRKGQQKWRAKRAFLFMRPFLETVPIFCFLW